MFTFLREVESQVSVDGINSYDDTKITKRGIWVTISKVSCIMSFKPKHVRARLNSIFVGYGNFLVYPLDVFSRIPARRRR